MNMAADTAVKSLEYVRRTVIKDLSNLLEADVEVSLLTNTSIINSQQSQSSRKLYETLEDLPECEDILFDTYEESPSLLQVINEAKEPVAKMMHTALLKSNCRVTSQPDWGDCYIYIKSKKRLSRLSLLKYIVSFRDECHFHEEICETIYKRLLDTFEPDELCVMCLYARRGGIDINPIRATSEVLLNRNLTDIEKAHIKTPKQ